MKPFTCTIRKMEEEDGPEVLAIYEQSIRDEDVTCVTRLPEWDAWSKGHDEQIRFVAEKHGSIIGFIAVSRVFCVEEYRGVGEISIYVQKNFRHLGVGTQLLNYLIHVMEEDKQLAETGYYMLQSRIFTNNENSIALHEKTGFRLVGRREKILRKKGIWRDVYVYERRTGVF